MARRRPVRARGSDGGSSNALQMLVTDGQALDAIGREDEDGGMTLTQNLIMSPKITKPAMAPMMGRRMWRGKPFLVSPVLPHGLLLSTLDQCVAYA